MPGPRIKPTQRSTAPSKIRLPDISAYTSEVFPLKTNPHHHEVEAASYEWFDKYGVYSGTKHKKFFGCGLGLVTAMCYPDADLEHLRPTMDFILWMFAFDDMTDEGELRDNVEGQKIAVDATMGVLLNPDSPPPTFTIAASLHSFFNRMRANSGPGPIRAFIEATREYMQAVLQHAINVSADKVPTIEEYIQLRQDTSFIKPVLAMIEYSLGLDLPEEVRNDPTIAELELCTNNIITWANDIHSFPLEHARGDNHNFVYIAMYNKGLGLDAAMDYVNQLTRGRVDDFLKAKGQLRSFGPDFDEQVARYIQGMEHCMRGVIDWTFLTPRYFGADVDNVRETRMVEIVAPMASGAPITLKA